MKTAPLSRISRSSSRGFSLVEALVGMVIGTAAISMAVWLLCYFLANQHTRETAFINQRLEIDEIGLSLQNDSIGARKAFLFAGTLKNADGTTYAGGALTLSTPLCEITSSAGFLTASGLTLQSAGSSDIQTILVPNALQKPLLLVRKSSIQSDGYTEIVVVYSGGSANRRVAIGVPTNSSTARMAAAVGSASTASDGHVVLILPNPLALSFMTLSAYNAGMRLDLPWITCRSL